MFTTVQHRIRIHVIILETSKFYLYWYNKCGFGETEDDNCDSKLWFAIERKWKEKRDWMISNGYNDKYEWEKCGNLVIDNMIRQNERSGKYVIENKDLTLICLF